MSSDLLTHMGIRVEEEFRAPVPEGWVALVESALYASSNHPGISQKSFALEDKAELLWIYYTRHMPLWFSDEPKGVCGDQDSSSLPTSSMNSCRF